MDPALAPGSSTKSVAVFADGLGERCRTSDVNGTDTIELLCLREELTAIPSFEFALRERASRLASFRHTYYARVRSVDRLSDAASTLAVASDAVKGVRLSNLLAATERRPQTLDINASLHLTRQLVAAVAMLHENARDVAHGAIGPERIIVTPNARVVITEYVLGAALEQLHYSHERYWKDLRIALPPGSGPIRFDHRADVTQVGVVALSLILGRSLRDDEYPGRIADVLASAWAISSRGGLEPLPHGLRSWLARAMQLDARHSFATAFEAREELDRVLSGEDEEDEQAEGLTAGTATDDMPVAPATTAGPSPSSIAATAPTMPVAPALPTPPAVTAAASEPVVTPRIAESDLPPLADPPAPAHELRSPVAATGALSSSSAPPFGVRAPLATPSSTPAFGIRAPEPPPAQPPVTRSPAPTSYTPPFGVKMLEPSPAPASVIRPPAASNTPLLGGVRVPPPFQAQTTTSASEATTAPAASSVVAAPAAASSVVSPSTMASSILKTPPFAPPVGGAGVVLTPMASPIVKPHVAAPPTAMPPAATPSRDTPAPKATPLPPAASVGQPSSKSSWSPSLLDRLQPDHDPEGETENAAVRQPQRRWGLVAAAAVALVAVSTGGVFAARRYLMPAAESAVGTLSINSNPPGARVTVDGQDRGVTPLSMTLKPGGHVVELQGAGEPRTVPVTIVAGAQVSQYLELPKSVTAFGQLQIRSEPAGAEVTVDGIGRGKAPVLVESLAPGDHAVVLEGEGATVRQAVSVEAGMTASLVVPLVAAESSTQSGWISVNAPAEVQLYENKRLIGTSQSDRVMVSAGKHEIEMINETLGYRAVRTVQVPPGKLAAIKVEWPKGTIAINALPWAEVWIDGEKVGETPIGNLSLPIGGHEIVFRHPELGEQKYAATVSLTAPARVSVDLRKK
jgi:hypothetical protein